MGTRDGDACTRGRGCVVLFIVGGAEVVQRRVPAAAVVEGLDVVEDRGGRVGSGRPRAASRSSVSRVAKKLSAMALSKQSPTEPIESAMPASRQRRPNARLVYWADSTGRRNTSRWRCGMVTSTSGWRSVRCGRGCGRRVGRRRRGARIASGSGRRSPAACRARTRPPRPVCHPRSGRGGSGRLAGCRRSRWPRCRGATCRSPSARRSRSCTRKRSGCARSPAGSVVIAVDDLAGAASQRVDPQQRVGVSGDDGAVARRAARQPPEGRQARRQRPAARVRAGSSRRQDRSARRRARGRPRRCASSVAVTAAGRIDGGRSRGARSRSRTGCGSTSPMMSRCGSRTRRSTRRSTSRAAVRSSASSSPACAPGGRCASHGHAPRAREEVRHPGGHDQRTARRGRGSRRARPLGRRPHHRSEQLGDRHARRAHHPVHDAAAPAAHGRPRHRATRQERPALAGHGAEAVRDAIADADHARCPSSSDDR